MKTDEQAAKEYAESLSIPVQALSQYDTAIYRDAAMRTFLAGCQHKQSEADEKAMMFAEWCAISGWSFHLRRKIWVKRIMPHYDREQATTSELYNSPEFLGYYEERRRK